MSQKSKNNVDRSENSDTNKIDSESESTDGATANAKTTIAITSTNSLDEPNQQPASSKFKYTAESLSPISHSYDDATGTHTLFTSRSPERSFSSESLCSTESVESNDSKSSIRLIESKFNNRNGTLERQSNQYTPTSVNVNESSERKATGLQVLILWNNNLTSACATSSADLFECTEYLQIINFGQNPIGNDFLVHTKSSLKMNESVISMGLQATNITCDGLKILADILQFGGNTTLQRIDLRNNILGTGGLSTLSGALSSNKTITRIDLDDTPKNDLLPINSEYQRLVSTIRQQCLFNENPPIQEAQQSGVLKASTSSNSVASTRVKRTNLTTRKISLTCPSTVKIQPKQQLLEPVKKQVTRSPSPILSPSSPLTSPSRNRFQVSRVSESSSSGIGSKSPSSSSSSPTFFPSSSRFRVVAVTESTNKKVDTLPSTPLKNPDPKPIDIPTCSVKPYMSISNSAIIVSSQSDEQLDYDEKRFIDLDSCSSFSSSIDSIDRQTSDISSTDSFDILDKNESKAINSASCNDELFEDKKDIFSNENTLTVSTSSSSSNEGLTLTTNSPAELSPKQDQKRTRKTSWIQSAIGGSGSSASNKNNENLSSYPATLDKLLNLFHHPSSIFLKTSPDSSVKATDDHSFTSSPTQSQPQQKQSGMGQKENSISGFLQSLVSLTHNKKEDKTTSQESSTILQNISPENTIGKNVSNSQMLPETIPKSVKKELKENISPENTISCDNIAILERKMPSSSKVVFVVGDDDCNDQPIESVLDESFSKMNEVLGSDDLAFESHTLGDITRDSLAIIKPTNDQQQQDNL